MTLVGFRGRWCDQGGGGGGDGDGGDGDGGDGEDGNDEGGEGEGGDGEDGDGEDDDGADGGDGDVEDGDGEDGDGKDGDRDGGGIPLSCVIVQLLVGVVGEFSAFRFFFALVLIGDESTLAPSCWCGGDITGVAATAA